MLISNRCIMVWCQAWSKNLGQSLNFMTLLVIFSFHYFSTNHQEMVKSVPYACTINSVKFIVILWWFNEIFQKQIYRSFQSWAVRKVSEFAKACSKTVCIICLAPDWNRVIARGSEKGRSLISAYRSLAITTDTPGFKKLSMGPCCILTSLQFYKIFQIVCFFRPSGIKVHLHILQVKIVTLWSF